MRIYKKERERGGEASDVMNTDQGVENISFLTSTLAVMYSLINTVYSGQGHYKCFHSTDSDNQRESETETERAIDVCTMENEEYGIGMHNIQNSHSILNSNVNLSQQQ